MFIPYKRKLLAAVVGAVCLSGLTQEASAAPLNNTAPGINIGSVSWPAPNTPVGPIPYAKEQPDAPMLLTTPAPGAFDVALNGGINHISPGAGSQAFFVKLSLSDSATFENTFDQMTMECATAGGGNVMSGVLSLGAAGSNLVWMMITGGGATALNPLKSGCVVRVGNATNPGLIGVNGTQNNISVSGHVQYWDGTQPVAGASLNGTYITFIQGLFDWYKPNTVANQGKIDTTSDSVYLADMGSNAQRVTAVLGYVRYGATANVSAYHASGGPMYAKHVSGVGAKFRITLSGPPVDGASKVLLLTGIQTDCSQTNDTRSASPGVSVSFMTDSKHVSAGFTPCLVFDGTTPIPAGQTYASITLDNGLLNSNPVFTGPQPLLKFKENGCCFDILSIAPSNSPELSVLRFYNKSNREASVHCSLYGMDGTIIGSAYQEVVAAAEFRPKTAVVKCGSDGVGAGLETYCTNKGNFQAVFGTTWTGRAWAHCKVDLDCCDFKVMVLNRNGDNVLTNLTDSSSGDCDCE